MSRSRKDKTKAEVSANVRVCVRTRPLFDAEKKEAPCVKTSVAEKNLTIRGKIYGPFDQVFNEGATQPDVYEKVARQNVELVLQGYNCTIFAYGQTGTGKTYCMEGGADKAYSGNWKTDPHLGIIPRAIEQIFNSLETEGAEEYCIRVSYVELYNEELYDLLAATYEDSQRIRLYEDPAKKGSVIVSGAEEVPVRTREEVFKLLQRGAARKTMAETLMNNRSSRSHCVFVVNVVVRETTLEGQELVRQGKLNLVDLAGSESIGRSGACGQRAKEAGNINQSLLTLGRCITSLTTNAGHIPYRESKLTRLLQDSLGGSTVTTIIATISPSAANFEETLSTLEYASRAKNIRNHPEINEKMSRKAMLKEMSDVIEKLQRDLRNAREKNGIFLSEESYAGMEDQIKAQQKTIEELEGQLEGMMGRLQALVEDMAMMDEQYRALYERKRQVEDRLAKRVEEVETTKKELIESNKRGVALKATLDEMHEVALRLRFQSQQLQRTAFDSVSDLEGVWRKVGALALLAQRNVEAMESMVGELMGKASTISTLSTNGQESLESDGGALKALIEDNGRSINSTLEQWSQQSEVLDADFEQLHAAIAADNDGLRANGEAHLAKWAAEDTVRQTEMARLVAEGLDRLQAFKADSSRKFAELAASQATARQKLQDVLDAEKSRVAAATSQHEDRRQQVDAIVAAYTQQAIKQAEDVASRVASLLREESEASTMESKISAQFFDTTAAQLDVDATTGATKIDEFTRDMQTFADERASISEKMRADLTLAKKTTSQHLSTMGQMLVNSNAAIGTALKGSGEKHTALQQEGGRARAAVAEALASCSLAVDKTISGQVESGAANSRQIIVVASEIESLATQHRDTDIVRPVKSGGTPVKRSYEVLAECEFVPRIDKMLVEHGYDAPARRSLYMTRDSILLADQNVMSPAAVQANKKSRLEQLNEEEEVLDAASGSKPKFSDDEVETLSAVRNNVTSRRPLSTNNQ
ncbi:unnamed protein product, partial [Mesorhabditis spiculigera]